MRKVESSIKFYITLLFALAMMFSFIAANSFADMHKKEGQAMTEEVQKGANEATEETQEMAEETAEETKEFAKSVEQELDEAVESFKATIENEKRIPAETLANAKGIAVFPNLTKAGFVVGGSHGDGVLMLNQKEGWSGPLFVDLYGASIGAQIGVEETDLFMVFNTQRSIQAFQDGELTLGAEASVAAGQWGEKGAVDTNADVIVYKQTEGLFAGVSLSGSMIKVDEEANDQFYNNSGRERAYYGSEEIFQGKNTPKNESADELIILLRDYE